MFEYEYDVTVVEKEDCKLLSDALKVYRIWVESVKATCRSPIIDGIPADELIKKARRLKESIDGAEIATLHARRWSDGDVERS